MDAEFTDFIQKASLSGFSKPEQDEIISEFFAKEIPMVDVVFDILSEIWAKVRRNRFKVTALLIILLFGWYYLHVVQQVRSGAMEVPSWQMEVDAVLRTFQKKISPYVDVSYLYYKDCILPNPIMMFKSDVDYLECKREVVTSLTAKDEHLVKGGSIKLPFLIRNTQEGWYLNTKTGIKAIIQEFKAAGSASLPCFDFPSYSGPKDKDQTKYLEKFDKGELTGESEQEVIKSMLVSGCSKLSNRIIRNFTLRPRFLDNNAESLGVMQLLLIKPDQEEDFIFDYNVNGRIWIANIVGSAKITLTPYCNEALPTIVTMEPGDIMAVGEDVMIQIERLHSNKENILISSEFTMDSIPYDE